jgi:hypothetical protein
MRRVRRFVGTILVAGGVVLMAWALVVWAWLTLQARHPRLFATQRYLAFGKPVSVAVRGTARISPTAIAAAANA